ncbi:Aldehyde dehydrogenase N-terminal [Penicillium chermesinum]|uniref:Aldehyde dehydrogenase N-terminal n=1 Tax=Penicillium chermesinum TaxID=63820 RepID=A0A9W9NC92_9EURO|nr:Aldehyde dehydrogenase N-terminal [Penicillium chermesinum]KAJ5217207.1 Aldehyde dehydrogenase N-terminal [Penicillium chermesinum]KAJ6171177.1 Aldehyde dehydrogenase N-terminal [Penicillium chermesinum]
MVTQVKGLPFSHSPNQWSGPATHIRCYEYDREKAIDEGWGKSLEDANLDLAAQEIVKSIFLKNGQICMSTDIMVIDSSVVAATLGPKILSPVQRLSIPLKSSRRLPKPNWGYWRRMPKPRE